MPENNILIVDDEPNVLSALQRIFMDEQCNIYTAQSGAEGMNVLKSNPIKLVISDEMMPGMSGSEFLSLVKEHFPDVIRIMLTGQASIDAAMRAINKGEIYRFFTKPWDDVEIRLAVRAAVEKYDLEEENRRLIETVRNQAINLKLIERQFPGITELQRDDGGRIVLSDIAEDELARIIAQCESEIS
jgi:DNA-binding NtrC family response regulator